MKFKYSKSLLNKLEDVFAESEYMLRYEKGSFKSGYCILKETQIVIVNKYYSLEGKINCLIDILRELDIDLAGLSDKNKKFYSEIIKTETQKRLNL